MNSVVAGLTARCFNVAMPMVGALTENSTGTIESVVVSGRKHRNKVGNRVKYRPVYTNAVCVCIERHVT